MFFPSYFTNIAQLLPQLQPVLNSVKKHKQLILIRLSSQSKYIFPVLFYEYHQPLINTQFYFNISNNIYLKNKRYYRRCPLNIWYILKSPLECLSNITQLRQYPNLSQQITFASTTCIKTPVGYLFTLSHRSCLTSINQYTALFLYHHVPQFCQSCKKSIQKSAKPSPKRKSLLSSMYFLDYTNIPWQDIQQLIQEAELTSDDAPPPSKKQKVSLPVCISLI